MTEPSLGERHKKDEGCEFGCLAYCQTRKMSDDKIGSMGQSQRLGGY